MLASKTHPKSMKNRSKNYQKKKSNIRHPFLSIFPDFGRILGSKLGLCWGYVGYETLSKTTSKKNQKITSKKKQATTAEARGAQGLLAINIQYKTLNTVQNYTFV